MGRKSLKRALIMDNLREEAKFERLERHRLGLPAPVQEEEDVLVEEEDIVLSESIDEVVTNFVVNVRSYCDTNQLPMCEELYVRNIYDLVNQHLSRNEIVVNDSKMQGQ